MEYCPAVADAAAVPALKHALPASLRRLDPYFFESAVFENALSHDAAHVALLVVATKPFADRFVNRTLSEYAPLSFSRTAISAALERQDRLRDILTEQTQVAAHRGSAGVVRHRTARGRGGASVA